MERSTKGFRRGTRKKLSNKNINDYERLTQKVTRGETIVLDINPAIHSGQIYPRFQGAHGKVISVTGESVNIEFYMKNKLKKISTTLSHIKKL